MKSEINNIFKKLNYIKSDDYIKKSREKATKDLIKKVDKIIESKMREAFLAGFLASKEGFNGQIPYSASEEWFDREYDNAGVRVQGLLVEVNNDLSLQYSNFTEGDLWYQKILAENDIDLNKLLKDGLKDEVSFLAKSIQI